MQICKSLNHLFSLWPVHHHTFHTRLFHSSFSAASQKWLFKEHQGASADALPVSLHLPLILTLLRLSQKHHPSGHLIHFCHSVYRKHTKDFMEPRTNHREGKTERRACSSLASAQDVNWGENSFSMILHSSLLPRALLKIEFLTQLTGSRDNLSASSTTHAALKLHSCQKQSDVMLGCLVRVELGKEILKSQWLFFFSVLTWSCKTR